MKSVMILSLALMLLAISAAVALMPQKDYVDEPGRYTSEAYVMAVDRENINICERWYPIDRNKVKVFDIDRKQIPLENLQVPCLALFVIQERGDKIEIREIHTQITYRVNDMGQVIKDRQAYIW